MEKDEAAKVRILMFPWLAHGHISPFVELSNRLSATNKFSIYLCSTAVNLDLIRQGLSEDAAASLKLVELQMPSSPELPPELHTTRNLPSHLTAALLQAFQDSSCSFTEIIDTVNPNLLMYDYFQPWAPKMASSRGIPSLLFSTSGATSFSFFHHLFTEGTEATFPYPAIRLPEKETDAMLDVILPNIKDGDDHEFAFGAASRSTEVVVLKSCRELDGKYQDHLSVLCKKRILCTGPLIASDAHRDDSEIVEWLNRKDVGTTIYISFGSQCFLTKKQIAEIARGLRICGANFLWVIRFPASAAEEEAEAIGLIKGDEGLGLVVTRWAPQRKILQHPSVAGFVSHCGWSSVVESLYYGVPLIAVPMEADQPLNSQLIVELGAGVQVAKDAHGLFAADGLAEAINKVIEEKAFREAARGLGEAMRDKEEQVFDELVQQLLNISASNNNQP